jgi:TRAP-type mannitol/chloroaromatic compound transport system substrate-binding protein
LGQGQKEGNHEKNSFHIVFSSIFVVVIIFGITTGQAFGAKKVILKVQSVQPTSIPGSGMVDLANAVKAATDGNIIMEIHEPGDLVAPFEILDAVSEGKIDAGLSASAFWQGKIPAAAFFTAVPFGPEAPEYLAWLYNGNGMKLYQEMYDKYGYNVKVFPDLIYCPESSGWFRTPIKSVEDLKGLKMRFLGLGGLAMEKLGVSVTVLPPGEIFAALEKKTLDATEFSMRALDQALGFYKLLKYNYYPGWHQQATVAELLINKDIWKGMTPGQQTLIEMACMANITRTLASNEAAQGKVIRDNMEKRGVSNMVWSDEMLGAFKKAWMEVVEENCAKDPFFKKVWEDLSAFRAEYAYWSTLGFLPRQKAR